MTQDELRRRAEAVHRWPAQHQADTAPACPVCAGIKRAFRLDPPGPYGEQH